MSNQELQTTVRVGLSAEAVEAFFARIAQGVTLNVDVKENRGGYTQGGFGSSSGNTASIVASSTTRRSSIPEPPEIPSPKYIKQPKPPTWEDSMSFGDPDAHYAAQMGFYRQRSANVGWQNDAQTEGNYGGDWIDQMSRKANKSQAQGFSHAQGLESAYDRTVSEQESSALRGIVRDDNRQNRDYGWLAKDELKQQRQSITDENRQHRDEGYSIRQEMKDAEREAKSIFQSQGTRYGTDYGGSSRSVWLEARDSENEARSIIRDTNRGGGGSLTNSQVRRVLHEEGVFSNQRALDDSRYDGELGNNDAGAYEDGSNNQNVILKKQALKYLGTRGSMFSKGALFAGGEAAVQYAQMNTQETLSGRGDLVAQATARGQLGGAMVGAAVGSFFPGWGSIIGAGVGGQLGGTVSQMVSAKEIHENQMQQSLNPLAAMSANIFGENMTMVPGAWETDYDKGKKISVTHPYINPALKRSSDLSYDADAQALSIRSKYWGTMNNGKYDISKADQFAMTGQELADTWESSYQSLVAAGINPETNSGMSGNIVSKRLDPDSVARSRGMYNGTNSPMDFTLINKLRGVAGMGATIANPITDIREGDNVPLYKALGSHADIIWGRAGKEIFSKEISPILSSINQTGGNYTDILMKSGPQSTFDFAKDVTPNSETGTSPGFDLLQAMEVTRQTQVAQRQRALGQLSVRGAGADALLGTMAAMTALGTPGHYEHRDASSYSKAQDIWVGDKENFPGALSSMTYKQLKQQEISDTFQVYHDYDTANYATPMAKLQGQRERMEVNPFAPGNIMAVDMQMIGYNKTQISQIDSRMKSLAQKNMLSEDAELMMTQASENLKTHNARMAYEIVQDVPNRIPAMSAGRPAFASRIDSREMTAMQFGLIGHPYRGAGAMNGSHLKAQDDWVRQYMDPSDIAPHSRYEGLNNGQYNKSIDMSKMEGLTQQMVDLLRQLIGSSSGFGSRPSQSAGSTSSLLTNRNTAPLGH